MRSRQRILLSEVILLVMIVALAANAAANQPADSKPWKVEVMLKSQIYLPTPRPVQDAFAVINNSTPNLVYRIERNQANDSIILAKEAYATANATPHDPYKITSHPLGPFPKGADLGFTMGQWIAATGTGTYLEDNGSAVLNLTFEKLVPNGIYSVWYTRVTMPPNYEEILTPVGASDGSQNGFKADANGSAKFNLKLNALPGSTNVTFKDYYAMYVTKKAPITTNITWTLISVAYNSDGKTHGATPGEFGNTTHVQMVHLMYPKPYRTYKEWTAGTVAAATGLVEGTTATANATATATANANANANANATTQSPKTTTPGIEGIFAITGLLAIGYLMLGKFK